MEDDRHTGDAQLGKALREVRQKAGLSQPRLAALLGVTHSTISRIETGRRSTGIDLVTRWYAACGLVLESVDVHGPQHARTIAVAVSELSEDEVNAVAAIIDAWPSLSERVKGRILELVDRRD